MRNSKGGYVIIYVVFVIIFLCIVAVGTCTVALNNLKTQTSYIEQMQDRYEAEGAIEQFMAEVCVACTTLSNSGYVADGLAKSAAKDAVAEQISEKAGESINLSAISWEEDDSQCVVTAAKVVGLSRAVATIDFSVNIAVSSYAFNTGEFDAEGNPLTVDRFEYHVTNATSKYLSYTLESAGGDAE